MNFIKKALFLILLLPCQSAQAYFFNDIIQTFSYYAAPIVTTIKSHKTLAIVAGLGVSGTILAYSLYRYKQNQISPCKWERLTHASYDFLATHYTNLKKENHESYVSNLKQNRENNEFIKCLHDDLNLDYLTAQFTNAYLMVKNKDVPKERTFRLDDYEMAVTNTPKEAPAVQKILVGQYKIHLMPKDKEDLMVIVEQLLSTMKTNDKFNQAVREFKFLFDVDQQDLEQYRDITDNKNIPPILVIYPRNGKENAQYVLNTVYALFKNREGLDITPRYNRKITSLIYYAQGDGDFKNEYYQDFYTEDKIHYNSTKFGVGNIDYALKNPNC